MGGSISKYVFRVRDPTYVDDDGTMLYIQRKFGERGGQTGKAQLHWLRTRRDTDVPCVILRCESRPARYTLLLSHGNMEDLGIATSDASSYTDVLGCDICLYEYSGFGIATGKPSEANCYADIEATYDFLVHDAGVNPNTIVLFGRSMGSGPTVYLASQRRVAGVILVAAFLSCARVVQNFKVTPPFDLFPNIDRIGKVYCQVLLIHGKRDQIVPFSHGMELARRCRGAVETLWVDEAGHNNVEKDFPSIIISKVRHFLDNLTALPEEDLMFELPMAETTEDDGISIVSRAASKFLGLTDSLFEPVSTFDNETTAASTLRRKRRHQRKVGGTGGQATIAATLSNHFSSATMNTMSFPRPKPQSRNMAPVSFDSISQTQPIDSFDLAPPTKMMSLNVDARSNLGNYAMGSDIIDTSGRAQELPLPEYLPWDTTFPTVHNLHNHSLHDLALNVFPPATTKKLRRMRMGLSLAANEQYDDEYLFRFLRARKFNVGKALDLLKQNGNLGARLGHDFREKIPVSSVHSTLSKGIFIVTGAVDSKRAPVLFLRPARYQPKLTTWGEVLLALVFLLDYMHDCSDVARNGITMVVDLKDYHKSNFSADTCRRFFHFIQRCYPVLIRSMLIVDAPILVKQWFIVRPMLKADLARVMSPRVTRNQLYKEISTMLMPDFLGGDIDTSDPILMLQHDVFVGH